ncbi:MAG TPA: hydantoinase/oxoprolinase family protein [Steroidobacteraceae bacterium]|nr:hydantoinase/oxoprolinase family protein [Steroidobacteraceae bacterium]
MDKTDQGALWLGLDTGGTYTDAVLLEDGRRVVASAKALTTHWDLSIGLGDAIRAVLGSLPHRPVRAQVQLVSVSTTLATNAVVEGRFSPVASVLIGFDEAMLARSGLRHDVTSPILRIDGGHNAAGEELQPLDEHGLEAAVRGCAARVEGFAVASCFSVRNAAHELRARALIRSLSDKPVTCAHELSSKLDAPRRALTATLNARLTPQIRHLVDALVAVLSAEQIDAPLMIVKGDGSLMKADIALEYPVETILSGPAASVVGAGYLTGYRDFLVSDMGGTTTDCAVVSNGRPAINAEGALIGGWRTMVQAVDVRTVGLGGDSLVMLDRHAQLLVGPRKAMPLCLLAQRAPAVLADLRVLATVQHLPDHATQYAFRNPGRQAPAHLAGPELRVWQALTPEPRRVSQLVHSGPGREALRRLADAGLATIAAFTPTDAMHVLGRQHGWEREAAELGAGMLAVEERNIRGARETASAQAFSERVIEHVLRESARVVLATALAHDPGVEARKGSWGLLGDRLVEDIVRGARFSALVRADVGLARPLVAIGAPAAGYYQEVARRLGAQLAIPEHAAVCNAVGAVAGVVAQTVDVLVDQPTFGVFRVHDPAGSRDYESAGPAIEHARRVSVELALAAALRAGAADPHVETSVTERRAQMGTDLDYLAEALVRSTATGRPFAGHLHAER